MEAQGIPFEIAEIHGGIARKCDTGRGVRGSGNSSLSGRNREYTAGSDTSFYGNLWRCRSRPPYGFAKGRSPEQVFSADDKQALLQLLPLLHTGVYAMSSIIPGMVETSANLGVIDTKDDQVDIQFYPRSAIDQKVAEFVVWH